MTGLGDSPKIFPMESHSILLYFITVLASAVAIIPIFKRFGLSSVLGYLCAGALIGPFGFDIIKMSEQMSTLAEFGVVFLLFIIGLELKPSRLWVMRKIMLTSGVAQITSCLILYGLVLLSFNFTLRESFIVAFGLSLSSTALVLQMLSELNQLGSLHGRQAFSILLFQDIAVIPVLAILPFLATDPTLSAGAPGIMSFIILAGFIIAFHFGSRPLLRYMASVGLRELFSTFALLIVLAVAYLMHSIHLSMELGAFIAGILLSESEYRHQLETDIEPFKGLLLGIFFIGIGMQFEREIFETSWQVIALGTFSLMASKIILITLIARISGLAKTSSLKLAISLGQGGEFAFVLIALALTLKIVRPELAAIITPIVTLSMLLSPILYSIAEKIIKHLDSNQSAPKEDEIPDSGPKVILAGLGRFGQIPARVLKSCDIEFTALEHDPQQVDTMRKFGNVVYYGDATRIDLLRNAGAEKAKLIIISIAKEELSLKLVGLVQKNFPNLQIIARAHNRHHAFLLKEAGIKHIIRETFASALEASELGLQALNFSTTRSKSIVEKFRRHDEDLLKEQSQYFHSEEQLIKSSHRAFAQLVDTLKKDAESSSKGEAAN